MEKKVKYIIEKIGENQYRTTYWIEAMNKSLVQKEELELDKSNSDGTHSKETIELHPSTIASMTVNNLNTTTQLIDGFHVNVSPDNLVVGGTYFDIDSSIQELPTDPNL